MGDVLEHDSEGEFEITDFAYRFEEGDIIYWLESKDKSDEYYRNPVTETDLHNFWEPVEEAHPFYGRDLRIEEEEIRDEETMKRILGDLPDSDNQND